MRRIGKRWGGSTRHVFASFTIHHLIDHPPFAVFVSCTSQLELPFELAVLHVFGGYGTGTAECGGKDGDIAMMRFPTSELLMPRARANALGVIVDGVRVRSVEVELPVSPSSASLSLAFFDEARALDPIMAINIRLHGTLGMGGVIEHLKDALLRHMSIRKVTTVVG